MEHVEHLSRLLVSDDPLRAADKILGFLVSFCEAKAGAVLSLEGGEPVVFLSRKLGLETLAALRALWSTHRAALGAGRAVLDGRGHSLAPLLDNTDFLGVLYLEAPRQPDQNAISLYAVSLAQALKAAATSAPEHIASMREDDLQRLQLLKALNAHEWNIAQVARILGVTRRTIYLRLERFGIKRQRVPKTLRRRPRYRECPA